MIRQALLKRGIVLTDEEYQEILDIVWNDIKFNYFSFGKIVTFKEVIEISVRCSGALIRCKVA